MAKRTYKKSTRTSKAKRGRSSRAKSTKKAKKTFSPKEISTYVRLVLDKRAEQSEE